MILATQKIFSQNIKSGIMKPREQGFFVLNDSKHHDIYWFDLYLIYNDVVQLNSFIQISF